MLFLGVDLAWRERTADMLANQTAVVALEADGTIRDADWTVGIDETLDWIDATAEKETLLLVDAPLVVNSAGTQRLCEKQVAQRYMHPWKVGANSTHPLSPRLGGVRLRRCLEGAGWRYSDGFGGPPNGGRTVSECYPYTTIVGVEALGYDERPLYKRRPRRMKVVEWRPLRAANCDELIRRVAGLVAADPPVDLRSHETTAKLVHEPSPLGDVEYKSREDLLDAAICAWTAAVWHRWGTARCQVLGGDDGAGRPMATMIAPARPEQRPGSSAVELAE